MRIDGKLAKWNDDRGFGFISPTHGGEEIFAHISAFPNDGQRPKLGESVSFEIEADKSGKKRAIAISYLARAKVSRQNQNGSGRRREKPGLASRLMPLLLVALAVYGYGEYSQRSSDSIETQNTEQMLNERSATSPSPQTSNSDTELSNAYKYQTSNFQIEGSGRVVRLLSDDNDGSRHQRFIVRLSSGQTLLVAHNIDLAPRIDSLAEGDAIRFYGQYEWNEKGGVIHWTHNDPSGSHVAGWIEHNGKRYQ
jgi:cold shock CspA family protein